MQDINDVVDYEDARTRRREANWPRCWSCTRPMNKEHAYRVNDHLYCEDCEKEAKEDFWAEQSPELIEWLEVDE